MHNMVSYNFSTRRHATRTDTRTTLRETAAAAYGSDPDTVSEIFSELRDKYTILGFVDIAYCGAKSPFDIVMFLHSEIFVSGHINTYLLISGGHVLYPAGTSWPWD